MNDRAVAIQSASSGLTLKYDPVQFQQLIDAQVVNAHGGVSPALYVGAQGGMDRSEISMDCPRTAASRVAASDPQCL